MLGASQTTSTCFLSAIFDLSRIEAADFNLIEPGLSALLLPDLEALPAGKYRMLRPERISLTALDDSPVKAIVKEVQYCGSHYFVLVEAGGQMLKVSTVQPLNKGDRFGLSLSPGHAWPV